MLASFVRLPDHSAVSTMQLALDLQVQVEESPSRASSKKYGFNSSTDHANHIAGRSRVGNDHGEVPFETELKLASCSN